MNNISSEKLSLVGARNLTWITDELPTPGPCEVLVQTRTGAISIGSELPRYCGTARTDHPASYPANMGYENVGVVLACGSKVQRVQPGERVVGFYGHRTHAIVPETQVIVVPDGISDALAILTILTCDAAKGVRKLAPRPEERTLITGASAMGLLTLFILRAYGVIHVDVIEPRIERHALARLLGASNVLQPQELALECEEYALAFECSSRDMAFALLQQHVQKQGRICITSDGNIEPLTLTPAFHAKELQLVATSDGWDYHQHAAWYFHEVQQHQSHLEQLFELEIAHAELIATFERLTNGSISPVKVLVRY